MLFVKKNDLVIHMTIHSWLLQFVRIKCIYQSSTTSKPFTFVLGLLFYLLRILVLLGFVNTKIVCSGNVWKYSSSSTSVSSSRRSSLYFWFEQVSFLFRSSDFPGKIIRVKSILDTWLLEGYELRDNVYPIV